MTEMARSTCGSEPLTVELLDQAPVDSRLVITAGDNLGRHGFGLVFDRGEDGQWCRRGRPQWLAMPAGDLIEILCTGWDLSWRLHHPGLVRVLPAVPLDDDDDADPSPGWVCRLPGCRVHWLDGFADLTRAGESARRHLARHAEWARAS